MASQKTRATIVITIILVFSVGFAAFQGAHNFFLSYDIIDNNINASGTIKNNTEVSPPLNTSPSPIPTFIITEPPESSDYTMTTPANANGLVVSVQELSTESYAPIQSTDTIYLNSSTLIMESNQTIKNQVIDATNLEERNAVLIQPGVENVLIENVTIINHIASSAALLSMGSNVTLRNVNFVNVPNAYPIYVASSHTLIEGCSSTDASVKALVFIDGGISDVHVNSNLVMNRPLVYAWRYTPFLTRDVWVENNTLINFPNPTYGIIFLATAGPQKGLYENVKIIGNKISAGPLAFNAIAIYGFTTNVVVENNIVDQSLSFHNGIGISSGINVTVNGNVIFGCVKAEEGGIEVESNPVHNRNTGFSENVNVTNNIVYNSNWGIYVRVYVTDHPYWNGTLLLSKNILIENNTVTNCYIGINLLHGENITVRNNHISAKTTPFSVDKLNVLNYTVTDNVSNP